MRGCTQLHMQLIRCDLHVRLYVSNTQIVRMRHVWVIQCTRGMRTTMMKYYTISKKFFGIYNMYSASNLALVRGLGNVEHLFLVSAFAVRSFELGGGNSLTIDCDTRVPHNEGVDRVLDDGSLE